MIKGIITNEFEKDDIKYAITIEHGDSKIMSIVCDLSISDNTEGLPVNQTGIITVSGGITSISLPDKCDIIRIYNTFIELCEEIEKDIKQEQNA